MNKSEFDSEMTHYYKDCDFLSGEDSDGIEYDNCSECYRYETCKKCYQNELRRTTK